MCILELENIYLVTCQKKLVLGGGHKIYPNIIAFLGLQ
jgi:hypothetical protein